MPVRSRSRSSSSRELRARVGAQQPRIRRAPDRLRAGSRRRRQAARAARRRACAADRRAGRRSRRCVRPALRSAGGATCAQRAQRRRACAAATPRSRGSARRKRTFCAMRSRSKQPLRMSRIASRARVLVEQAPATRVLTRDDRRAVDQRRDDPARRAVREPIDVAQRRASRAASRADSAPARASAPRCLRVDGSSARKCWRR